jgi:hypothetical protein
MTSKTTTKTASPRTSRRKSQRKANRINRQRRLQKQLQILLLERHSRRCIICHHPEREAIEEEFVHWRSPSRLAHDYKLSDYRTIYRHARAAGLLLQRRERLHSALDAFVESVDDVTFTGDTILRAMRAYSCIDSHGRWTEIPTQVQFSTSSDGPPPQPRSPYPRNLSTAAASDVIDIDPDEETEDDAEEDAPEDRVIAYDVLDVIRKYSNQAPPSDATASSVSPKIKSRSDATFCAAPPAQAVNVTPDDYDELDDDPDDDSDAGEEEESEEDAENALEEALASVSTESDGEDDSDDDPDDDPDDNPDDNNDPKNKSDAESLEEPTACAASPRPSRGSPAQPVSAVPLNSNHRGRTGTATACAVTSKIRSRSDATACADSPAQALPRDVVRGHNPNDRSPSDRTDCAASPQPSRGTPAQPAAPPKPKPDADGLIWHPHPGYPNQEMSEPDAQGRVMYKIHMTTAASQLPSRQTDAQHAAELIYRSVIKKYGNP